MLQAPPLAPAASFEEGLERVRALQQLDGAEIGDYARTAVMHHGARTRYCAILLHGFTNHPGQYREFAPLVYERGMNVLIPRFPEHGDRNRLTGRIKRMTAEMLADTAAAAVDAGCGLGERVVVAGISASALVAAYLADYRSEIARAVLVAPEFAILNYSRRATRFAAAAARMLPDFMLWWDPRVKTGMHPSTAYPRFSTHALAQTLRLADDVYAAAGARRAAASSIGVLVNPQDPAVNNRVTFDVVKRWRSWGTPVDYLELDGLPRNHDIIEPDNPKARVDVVYPALLQMLLEGLP